ncbi:MAG TPA: hypothetical protein VJT50_04870 [Pyrinomonadaceae bacterium]|nr:hypothetical protein [Pyrinomonadaceae bacterium]
MNFFLFFITTVLLVPAPAAAQQQKPVAPAAPPKLTRTTITNETRRLGYGGTVTIVGAPDGSITVEGWNRSDVEVRAETQMHADSEKDLDQLAAVNGVILDEDLNHVRIMTTGMHDRAYMKKVAKNFPKQLLNLPWRVDYRIRVPIACDLDINGGRGPITVTNVDGNIRISSPQSQVTLLLGGGTLSTTIAAGQVALKVSEKSWRHGSVEIAVAAGDIELQLPGGFNGDLDADVLRTGEIVNSLENVAAREKPGITKQQVRARIGTGGSSMRLSVGDGRIAIKKSTDP